MKMKKNKIFAAVFAVMTAAACTNELDNSNPNEDSDLVPVEFTGMTDGGIEDGTKTTLNSYIVNWEDKDEVTLLSGEGYATATKMTISGINSNGSATFNGLAEKGSASFLALYPHKPDHLTANPYNDGGLTVTIPTEQRPGVVDERDYTFQSGANVSVAYSEDDALKFRNIGAVLVFQMYGNPAKLVTKVVLKARKSETEYCKLTGSSVVTLDEETKLPVVGEGDTEYITLLPEEGKSVFTGGRYAFVVYPGDYKGFELTFTDTKGREFTYTNDTPLSLKRNQRSEFNRFDYPTPSGSLLPEGDMTVTVNFNNEDKKWPFIENIVPVAKQVKSGETYTFKYSVKYNEKETYEPLSFVISRNSSTENGYEYNGASLKTNSGTSTKAKSIKLPGISGKYLKSVKLHNGTTAGKVFYIDNVKSTSSADTGVAEFNFPYTTTSEVEGETVTTTVNSEKGVSYTMSSITGNAFITKLELLYTATEPVVEATE